MKWPIVEINTPDGPQEAVAPLIVSASRATDIPAFHAQWLMERLRAGHCAWVNPYNRAQRQYISFSQTKAIVFWSKNPAPLLPYLHEISDLGFKFYFQFTLNDYEKEQLEPHVPPLQERIATFKALSDLLGRERVIWRFDPVAVSSARTVRDCIERIDRIGHQLNGHTDKFVFSFVDINGYKKVRGRVAASVARELSEAEMHEFCALLREANSRWPRPLALATCSEKIDLEQYAILHNKCIDDALLCKICRNDPALLKLFGRGMSQASLLGDNAGTAARPEIKDKGQRLQCCCVPSKDIGAYNTCPHLCRYCYANYADGSVMANMKLLGAGSESLLPGGRGAL